MDFERLKSRTQQTVYRIHEKKQITNHLQNNGIKVFTKNGPAHFFDPHTIPLSREGSLQARKFIICAAGHARRINFPGSELALTHSDIWGLKKMPRSIAIVGGAADFVVKRGGVISLLTAIRKIYQLHYPAD